MVAAARESDPISKIENLFEHFKHVTEGDRGAAAALTLAHATLAARNELPLSAPSRKNAYSIAEAAEYLSVGERTLRRLIDDGKLNHHRIGKGRGTIRIRPDDLVAFQRQTTQAGKSEKRRITLSELKAL